MNRSDKVSFACGCLFELAAIYFVAALFAQFFNHPLASTSAFKLAQVLFQTYGYSSILIPILLLATGLAFFAGFDNLRTALYIVCSLVPFATVVASEKIAQNILSADTSSLKIFKVAAVGVICPLLIALEYVLIGMFADVAIAKNALKNAENNSSTEEDDEEIQTAFSAPVQDDVDGKIEENDGNAENFDVDAQSATENDAEDASNEDEYKEPVFSYTPKVDENGEIENLSSENNAQNENLDEIDTSTEENADEKTDAKRKKDGMPSFTIPTFVPYDEQIAKKDTLWKNYPLTGDFIQKPNPDEQADGAETPIGESLKASVEQSQNATPSTPSSDDEELGAEELAKSADEENAQNAQNAQSADVQNDEVEEESPIFVNFKRIAEPDMAIMQGSAQALPSEKSYKEAAEAFSALDTTKDDDLESEPSADAENAQSEIVQIEDTESESASTDSASTDSAQNDDVNGANFENAEIEVQESADEIFVEDVADEITTIENENIADVPFEPPVMQEEELALDQATIDASEQKPNLSDFTSKEESAFLQDPFAEPSDDDFELDLGFDESELENDADETPSYQNDFAGDASAEDAIEEPMVTPYMDSSFVTADEDGDLQNDESDEDDEPFAEDDFFADAVPVAEAFDAEELEPVDDFDAGDVVVDDDLGEDDVVVDENFEGDNVADDDFDAEEIEEAEELDGADELVDDESADEFVDEENADFGEKKEKRGLLDVANGFVHAQNEKSVQDTQLSAPNVPVAGAQSAQSAQAQNVAVQNAPAQAPKPTRTYKVPAEGLLTSYPDSQYWIIDEETQRAAEILKQTLFEFKIEADVTGIRKGPVVTMFEILPAPGVKLARIVSLQDNIALRLAASSVRIVAPIPGKHAVGIEVPNKERAIVGFRELIDNESPLFNKMEVPVVLGKDISGEAKLLDLAATPHLLIAGSTGSGKSVCVNTMILSILYKRSPQMVKMILIDPKIVELKLYNDIPHLLTPVITEPKRAFQALQYCLCEMERRYALLDQMGVRDIKSYNRRIDERHLCNEKLPYIIVIIDEFADLMATTGKELESTVARLAAMSRAVGIHLVLATQRPSIDVITGLIKANIPTRIAFMVASKMDSRIIIDQVGAEKLLGKGDMLYASAVDPFPVRIQGTFVSDQEVENVVDYVKQLGEPDYIDEEIFVDDDEDDNEPQLFVEGDDPLYEKALEIVLQAGKASASYIQRRLKIGYNRAARLVEEMEERGIVGPANGSKPRDIIHIPARSPVSAQSATQDASSAQAPSTQSADDDVIEVASTGTHQAL